MWPGMTKKNRFSILGNRNRLSPNWYPPTHTFYGQVGKLVVKFVLSKTGRDIEEVERTDALTQNGCVSIELITGQKQTRKEKTRIELEQPTCRLLSCASVRDVTQTPAWGLGQAQAGPSRRHAEGYIHLHMWVEARTLWNTTYNFGFPDLSKHATALVMLFGIPNNF